MEPEENQRGKQEDDLYTVLSLAGISNERIANILPQFNYSINNFKNELKLSAYGLQQTEIFEILEILKRYDQHSNILSEINFPDLPEEEPNIPETLLVEESVNIKDPTTQMYDDALELLNVKAETSKAKLKLVHANFLKSFKLSLSYSLDQEENKRFVELETAYTVIKNYRKKMNNWN
jgi:hypothetical protein